MKSALPLTLRLLLLCLLIGVGVWIFDQYISTKKDGSGDVPASEIATMERTAIAPSPGAQVLPEVIDESFIIEPIAFVDIASVSYPELTTVLHTIIYSTNLSAEEFAVAFRANLEALGFELDEQSTDSYIIGTFERDRVEVVVGSNPNDPDTLLVTLNYTEETYEASE